MAKASASRPAGLVKTGFTVLAQAPVVATLSLPKYLRTKVSLFFIFIEILDSFVFVVPVSQLMLGAHW